ncbi:MAG: hypothetical protein QXN15_00515 [Candidatus Jordarchaeales archaeon]|nr:hypothetical protein [Candidatus Jordarchaeia archaeon]
MEDSIREVMEKVIGESIQRSIEPFMRALLKSIKLVKDEIDSIGGELETYSKESSGRLSDLSKILQSIYERIQELKAAQGERELQLSMVSSLSQQGDLEAIIERKVKAIIEPIGRAMQKILDQQIALLDNIEKVIETLKNIEEKSGFGSKLISGALSLPLAEEREESKTEEDTTVDNSKGVLFSQLEEAVKSLSGEMKIVEAKEGETLELKESGVDIKKEVEEEITEEGAAAFEQASKETPTVVEELTLDKLQERVAEIDREITDLTFDRMRGILSEAEYQEKKANLMKEKEELKKKIEEVASKV